MNAPQEDRIVRWAKELQFIAQAGLTYSKNPYDLERFQRIRDLSAEMMSEKSGLSPDRVKELFCNETGFQTPKLDTRAAVFEDGRILLVKENDGKWSLPGGWCDMNQTIRSNTEKEVLEEAGLRVAAERIILLHDHARNNPPAYAYNICKVFVLCRKLGGGFKPNLETTESAYFALDSLPELSTSKNTAIQIGYCFQANADQNWIPLFD